MIKININGGVLLIDLYEIDLKNWLKISDKIIEKYGFKEWLKYTYEVIKGDPYDDD